MIWPKGEQAANDHAGDKPSNMRNHIAFRVQTEEHEQKETAQQASNGELPGAQSRSAQPKHLAAEQPKRAEDHSGSPKRAMGSRMQQKPGHIPADARQISSEEPES